MHPILVRLGPITIHTYGFLIVLGFLFCVFILRKKAQRENLNVDQLTDMAFWALVFGLIGGRILYIITLWPEFMLEPLEMLKFWKGGLVFYGGFLGGAGAYFYLAKKNRLPFWKVIDIATPSVAIAHAFGRLGCFTAGCCYGRPIRPDHPLAVVFTHPESIAPTGIALHPAQLYDSLNALLIFGVLEVVYRHKKFDGQLLALYLMLYSVGRYVVELFRGDEIRKFVFAEISTSQFISIPIFIVGAVMWFVLQKRSHDRRAGSRAR